MIERTGSLSTQSSTSQSGSFAVTVPADAEIMIMCVAGYTNDVGYSANPPSINGAVMTAVDSGGDSSGADEKGQIFYKISPTTGNFTWSWGGSTNWGHIYHYGFYKGINTSDLVRDTDGTQQGANPHATGTLTAQSGDMIVAWAHGYDLGSATGVTWTNATEQSYVPVTNSCVGSLAEASPSGNQSVSCTIDGMDYTGGCLALVMKAATGPTLLTFTGTSNLNA